MRLSKTLFLLATMAESVLSASFSVVVNGTASHTVPSTLCEWLSTLEVVQAYDVRLDCSRFYVRGMLSMVVSKKMFLADHDANRTLVSVHFMTIQRSSTHTL
jgi:putative heme iron utilization protein